ncbi:hypothetical protein CEXT_409221 [Caerostris extrusa]|uniref:Uncharacterized protein n=1 Tax=Caerostris extrusa TaxID=172846 RepID=A0AAV4VDP3_CAEEX|nr:hypothetical protein CEXT_409221 [Caerostris extrusa]
MNQNLDAKHSKKGTCSRGLNPFRAHKEEMLQLEINYIRNPNTDSMQNVTRTHSKENAQHTSCSKERVLENCFAHATMGDHQHTKIRLVRNNSPSVIVERQVCLWPLLEEMDLES